MLSKKDYERIDKILEYLLNLLVLGIRRMYVRELSTVYLVQQGVSLFSLFSDFGVPDIQMLVQRINDRLNIAYHVGNILFLLSLVFSCKILSFPD